MKNTITTLSLLIFTTNIFSQQSAFKQFKDYHPNE